MSARNIISGKPLLQQLLKSKVCVTHSFGGQPQYCEYSSSFYNRVFNSSLRTTNADKPTSVNLRVIRGASGQTTVKDLKPKTKEQERLDKAKAKKAEPPPIVLIDEKQGISIMSLEDAAKLAKKRGLFVVEAEDHGIKSGKQVYKLVTKSQFYGEDWKSKKEDGDSKNKKTKEEKTVLLKSKTDEHDVAIKTKNILKLVEKGHTVRVLIGQAGVQNQNPEIVYKIMENLLKDEPVRIIQKIVKNSQIRFQVMPPKVVPDANTSNPTKTAAKEKTKNDSDEDEP